MNDIDFTQTRPQEKRFRTLVRAYSHKPKNRFGDPEYVFMHVGKTGGTSINAFFRDCHNAGLRVPIVLNHNWSFQMARMRYPKAKIIVVLRDPLERIVSGFNFRLREGRPQGHPWSNSEAIAFSHFRNATSFLDALCSDEPQDISALGFCFRNINHLRRGYRYHFGDLSKEPSLSNETMHVIPMGDIGRSLPNLIQDLNASEQEKIPEVGNMYTSSILSASLVRDKKYMNLTTKMRSRIKIEYNTYDYLEQNIFDLK